MPKKILFVRTPPYDADPNSYNIQAVGLGKAFCRMGYDFDYITFKKRDQKEWVFYEHGDCKARFIEKKRIRILRMGINTDICDKEFLSQYDIIISREYYQIMTYLLSKNSPNVSMYSGPYYNMFMFKFVSPIYDKIFTSKINRNIKHKFVKSVLAKEFLENKGYDNVHDIGVGLDFERFLNTTCILPETQAIVDYMKNNKCILYVGALSDRKNYPFMLEVYKKVLKEDPDVKFVVIGKSKQSTLAKLFGKKDSSYEDEINKHLPENIRNGIFRINRIDNPQLKYVYPLAKAFILPSKLEIFGMVLLEAMYLGAPVITSRNGGSLSLMYDGKTGQIVDKFDSELWKDAVLKYINNPEYTDSVVKQAKHRVENEFTWDVIADKIIKVLNKD